MTPNPYKLLLILVLPLLLLWAGPAKGQVDELGPDFIAFVNGVNTLVPTFDGAIVNDPLDAENKVMKYDYGNWSFQGFRWTPQDTGVDMTANRENGDVLHLRFLSDPANVGMPGISIMLEDKASNVGDSPDADNPFRLTWFVPDSLHDGEWHDLTIPLPPATYDELEAARDAGTLDPWAENWVYSGSWAGFAIGLDQLGPNTAERSDLWREFQWDGVAAVGPFWDNQSGGGPIWLDDVYIGSAGLDLSTASEPVAAVASADFAAGDAVNQISWTEVDGAGGYNIYFAASPITDVTAPGVARITRAAAGTSAYDHAFSVPHPSLSPLEVHYAVSSLSQFGVENLDVSGSVGSVSNETLPVQPYITELTLAEADMLFTSLEEGRASRDGFPDGFQSFLVNEDAWFLGDAAAFPNGNEDFSAEVMLGYTAENELYLYAEVHDDSVFFGASTATGGDTWQWDSFEMGWGNYDVRNIDGGGIIVGSPHQEFQRESEPDYQFRLTALLGESGELIGNLHAAALPGVFNPDLNKDNIPGGAVVVEYLEDGTGKTSATAGWKMLALIPLNGIQYEGTNDVVLQPPASNEIRLIPFNVVFNDNDGGGRETQVGWSSRMSGGWWNTPAQWTTVALAGRGLAVASEDLGDVPRAFELEQNYPNPFNPSTAIRFSLPATEKVTLAVYDILGKRVATLLDGEQLNTGQHTVDFDASALASGVYTYRLQAGSEFVQSRRMLLVK